MSKTYVIDPGLKQGRYRVPNIFGTYDIVFYHIEEDGTHTIFQVIPASPYIYTVSLFVYAFINVLLNICAVKYGRLYTEFAWGSMLTLVQILYFSASFISVKQVELCGLEFFGKVVRSVDSGLFFVPLGIFKVVRQPKPPVEEQFPADPEDVFKRGDKEFSTLTEEQRNKLVLPIRILATAQEKADDVDSAILNAPLTMEFNPYIRFQIEQFWVFNVRIGTIAEAIRQLRDSTERALSEIITPLSPILISRRLVQINNQLRERLEELTEDSGIRIIEAAIPPPDYGKDVNAALQGIVLAEANSQETRITAEAKAFETMKGADAEKYQRTALGEGAANAKTSDLLALAEGAKALKVGGEVLVEFEKARAFATNPNTTIFIDGGSQGNAGGLLGVGARLALGGTEALKQKDSKDSNEE